MTVKEFLEELTAFADGWDDWEIYVTIGSEEDSHRITSFSATKLPEDDGWVDIHAVL